MQLSHEKCPIKLFVQGIKKEAMLYTQFYVILCRGDRQVQSC